MSVLDLVVIGGGIAGLGVARLAARNGLSVAVVEGGDLASGSSSRSSHLLHGGLRYLEHGQFALVREALEEREEVARMAPALTRPARFLVPLHRGGRVGPWRLRAGLQLYDWLAGAQSLSPHTMVRPAEALALEPGLSPDDLTGAGLYTDVVMDDGRLAIAVARDAAAHGALIHTWTEVTAARPDPEGTITVEARDRLTGAGLALTTRSVVNATGPWTDATRRSLLQGLAPGSPDPPALLRPSRGTHLLMPPLTERHALLFVSRSDGRPIFVVPFAGHSLVGTTEVEVASPPGPEDFRPTPEEVRYLRTEVGHVVPAAARAPVLGVFAGVRPLLHARGEVGAASREHGVVRDGALFTLAGGKYTTFRRMARDVVRAVADFLGHHAPLADPADPLPAPASEGIGIERVAAFAAEHEFARRLEDVLRRRTLWWLTPDHGRVAAPVVAAVLAERLGWSAERTRDELQRWEDGLREQEDLLRRASEGA